ncbi:MAG: ABC transporter ATP-binding protein [Alphaproteobacteria bacterium]|nr:ABC transporter ATP-binding protein [Alphaproteobacteria bacterium]
MAAVELQSITKRFGALAAVDDLSLTIAHGSLVCLLGPSGCGKTTTLRLVAGFVDPDRGAITVGGRTVSAPGRSLPPERRNMSMIFQSYALWPHMTIAENVGYGLKIRRFDKPERERRVAAILDVAHLSDLARRYPHELSGGQQQRVALARALVVEPETLLLDEPLSNLDANLRDEMRFEIRRLHDAYRYTTIYVTHDQTEAMTTADTIVVMRQGRVEQVGAPEDIYQRPRSEFVARFIGGTNIFRGRRIGADLVDCGAVVLRCGGGDYAAAGETAISVRQHDIGLAAADPAAEPQADDQPPPNEAAGRVVRHAFLGAHRDYLVSLRDGQEVRVMAPLRVNVPVGQPVRLRFPPEHCRALAS